jgi:hypothetical protein
MYYDIGFIRLFIRRQFDESYEYDMKQRAIAKDNRTVKPRMIDVSFKF